MPADGEKLTVLGGDEFSVERWREVDKKVGPSFACSMAHDSMAHDSL